MALLDNQAQCLQKSYQMQQTSNSMGSGVPDNNMYQLLNVIGRGSYGVVYRAANVKTGETVAMKHEVQGLSGSTLREMKILMALPRHPSIVEFKQVIQGGGGAVFVVMEYLPADLLRFIHLNSRPFTVTEIKWMIKQILDGVKFLHEHGVMHRDLKPENILIGGGSKPQLKICDFGLSRPFLPGASGRFTSGVCTLWYRAPELLQGSIKYSAAIDVWAVGCIMGEIVLKKPLFPGKSNADQLRCVYQGLPAAYVPWLRYYLGDSGFDLLLRLLAYDPADRITAKDALNHIWFQEYN